MKQSVYNEIEDEVHFIFDCTSHGEKTIQFHVFYKTFNS